MDFQNSYLPAGMIPTGTVPGGLAAVGLMEEGARNESRHLTEAEKEKLIFEYKDAGSEAERERILDSVPADEDVSSLFGGPSIG